MAKQTVDHAAEIHKATSAEIARQVQAYVARRTEITRTLADRYAASSKAGAPTPELPPAIQAARAKAREMLNGSTPGWLRPPSTAASPDETLQIERDAIDLVLRALGEQQTEIRAAESLVWVEENADRWRALCKEILLTAARLQALETRAHAIIETANIVIGTPLPMARWIGDGLSVLDQVNWSRNPLREIFADAIEQGVISAAEIKSVKVA